MQTTESKHSRSANILLAKDDVGRSKPSARELPPSEFAYGKAAKPDPEGAGVVLGSWQAHVPSPRKITPKDFVKLNALGLHQGLYTAKQAKLFRSCNDLRINSDPNRKLSKAAKKSLEHLTFGIAQAPSTPMNKVMSNYFGRNAELPQSGEVSPIKLPAISRRINDPNLLITAVKLSFKPCSPSTFKLKKFLKVGSRISTHRKAIESIAA